MILHALRVLFLLVVLAVTISYATALVLDPEQVGKGMMYVALYVILPAVGARRVISMRMTVVLPAPLGPRNPKISPL